MKWVEFTWGPWCPWAIGCHVHSTWLRTSSGSEKANGSCSASMHIKAWCRLVSATNLLWMYQCKVMAHADIAPCSVSARLGKCSPPPRCKQGTGLLLWVQRNCGSCPVTPDHAHNILHQSFIEAVPGVVDIPGTHQAQKNRSIPQGGPSQKKVESQSNLIINPETFESSYQPDQPLTMTFRGWAWIGHSTISKSVWRLASFSCCGQVLKSYSRKNSKTRLWVSLWNTKISVF